MHEFSVIQLFSWLADNLKETLVHLGLQVSYKYTFLSRGGEGGNRKLRQILLMDYYSFSYHVLKCFDRSGLG